MPPILFKDSANEWNDKEKPRFSFHSRVQSIYTHYASCYMDEVYGIIGMCFLEDSASGGASVQLQFLAEYMTYRMPIPAEDYDRCPILLTQPEQDRWTPLKLSQISMKGIKAPFTVKILSGGGHYPMEETALRQLVDNAKTFIGSL